MLGNSTFLDAGRRDSRKRRRVSERRRVFGRLGVTGPSGEPKPLASQSMAAPDRRRSSEFRPAGQQRGDSPSSCGKPATDQGKISMKIQFHIVIAPDNEPLILDSGLESGLQVQQQHHPHHLLARQASSEPAAGQQGEASPQIVTSSRQMSTESSFIGEHIQERLSRQGSSTRRRQNLFAMHNQQALDKNSAESAAGGELRAARAGSISAGALESAAAGDLSPTAGREPGLRSSTISGGMYDEATANFLARQQQQQQQQQGQNHNQRLRQASGSLTSTSSSGLLGQHQTLMASSNNIRQRLENREHIYFKRDGQRFGHEFTLKLAVDKSYRCLLKVRPLIPLQAISIQGHHVSFVDCSLQQQSSSLSSGFGGSLTLLNSLSSSPSSSYQAGSHHQQQQQQQQQGTRHQSIGSLLNGPILPHNSRRQAVPAPRGSIATSTATNHRSTTNHQNSDHETSSSTSSSRCATTNSNNMRQQHEQNSASLSSLSLGAGGGPSARSTIATNATPTNTVKQQLQQQLVKQQQQNQMMRHFSGSHASTTSSAGQLVYMFDWSAGRFEVNKNKKRTQVQTVLKFRNGEILSLPLQVKFYEPECKQHLSWGSQLHFIDYDCQINSMGQISVERIQYY